MKRAVLVLALVAALAAADASATRPKITVYAASSLTDVFPKIAAETYSFAGSNTLATQIEQGAPADVFASANMALPQQLHREGLCSRPVVFTRNALVIVVPTTNPGHITNIYDLMHSGVTVDVAAPGVPVGAYTQQVLNKLKIADAVNANVVSQETDVRTVLTKVSLGETDAGFVYSTDARTVPGHVKVIKVPARAQPTVQYGICVVSASGNTAAARGFVHRVLSRKGQAALRQLGFLSRFKRR